MTWSCTEAMTGLASGKTLSLSKFKEPKADFTPALCPFSKGWRAGAFSLYRDATYTSHAYYLLLQLTYSNLYVYI